MIKTNMSIMSFKASVYTQYDNLMSKAMPLA